jgi:SulP family sulfate permease
MLIPQSLAYALIAGLPPEIGLYSSILPMVAYALFGSSMTLAVGPVAVASLMTASALAPLAISGSDLYIVLAVQLAFLSGVMYLVFGLLRFGFLAHLLSHPVISGFISGSAILISIGQLKNIFGVKIANSSIFETIYALWKSIPQSNMVTMTIGLSSIVMLFLAKKQLPYFLCSFGVKKESADLFSKLAPMLVVIVSTIIVWKMDLHVKNGVSIVGQVPSGVPQIKYSWPSWEMLQSLWLPALLISVVGFVESVSVSQSLAIKRHQRINPDRELFGLGAANLASALSGGYPVTGGFARSVVNFSAGANTPLSGVISAVLMTIVLFGFTESFTNLPQAVLSATIIVAVIGLIDFSTLKETWKFDKSDSASLIFTCLGVIVFGVEKGIMIGVVFSLGAYLWRASHPHIAIVGRIPETEHFRNIERHQVEIDPKVLSIRIDESLFFGNVQSFEDLIYAQVTENSSLTDTLLIFSAVNRVDTTALMVLSDINRTLKHAAIRLHLAEVKGPVLDSLKDTDFYKDLTGECFLSANEAYNKLTTDLNRTNQASLIQTGKNKANRFIF